MPANPFSREIKIQRVPKNPMDKATLVSVYPKAIHEVKITLQPGNFHIPAAKDGDFELLVVETSSWFKEMEEGQPFLEIIVPSTEVARSIIEDFAILGSDGDSKKPGLFYIPGEFDKESIQKTEGFSLKLISARAKQKNWFIELVHIADALWIHSGGQIAAISDDMRMAAKILNLNEKVWLQDFQITELSRCPACGSMVNPQFPVCATCKAIINKELAQKLQIQFAM